MADSHKSPAQRGRNGAQTASLGSDALFSNDEVDLDARHPAHTPGEGFPAPSSVILKDDFAAFDDEDDPFAGMLSEMDVPGAVSSPSPLRAAQEAKRTEHSESALPSVQSSLADDLAMASPDELSMSVPAAPPVASPKPKAPKAAVPAVPKAVAAPVTGSVTEAAPEGPLGLKITRRYTTAGEDVWKTAAWELRTASITGGSGEIVFKQDGVEVPTSWSQMATNVVASKYFRGQVGTLEREYSVKQLVGRVADTFLAWGKQGSYFASDEDASAFHDELRYILIHQLAAFNSPVWFNLGWPGRRQAISACYINEVQDDMDSILELYKTEGMLFKDGSGSGLNLSPLRGSNEPLAAGGRSSGPISFMKGLDASAGSIKSGGSTRRAACMRVLDADHPDILDFINCKKDAEEKAHALIEAGYSGAFNVANGAYDTVPFQNANHSVRVTDEFMQAVESDGPWAAKNRLNGKPTDTFRAREVMQKIGAATWVCGDPGMQYDTTINDWHTCANTDRIYASNPCCITADTLVAVADGRNAVPIGELAGTEVPVYTHDHSTGRTTVSRMWNIGIKRESASVYRVRLDDGSDFRATDDHHIMLHDGTYRMVKDLKAGDFLMPFHSSVFGAEKPGVEQRYHWNGMAWSLNGAATAEVSAREGMKANGYAKALGAKSMPATTTIEPVGGEIMSCEGDGFYGHRVASVKFDGIEDVYDGTVDVHHNFAILTSSKQSRVEGEVNFSGIFIHNSEFMFLNSTACNLASLNLMRFRDDKTGAFDADAYEHVCRVVLTAQEIGVGFAEYPTPKIMQRSYDYRPLGLGYANLGALLMASGLPYDSDAGRAYAASVTAIMTGAAYAQSAMIARDCGGPFAGYADNKEPMIRVMKKHRAAVDAIDSRLVPLGLLERARKCWDEAVAVGTDHGYRNAQASVLAPTGTIGFLMDCDTTGVEPDIAIVKYKSLVGGGMMKIVNQTVPEALRRLGYSDAQVKSILEFIDQNDTIEGAPELKKEHLPIFDCAFRPTNGTRTIHYTGHVKMMSAVQPFLSGAISKTINAPEDATAEEISQIYIDAWKLGIKAVAVYRDNSKKTQPLSTRRETPAVKGDPLAEVLKASPVRRKLPDERPSITHKFSVGGHEGYLTVGLYPETNMPGEIFLRMSKEGSTISGLMDGFATAVSLSLQYGVPLATLVDKFIHSRFEPSGFTGNKDIPMAKSVMDYIFRWLALKFLQKEERQNVGLVSDQETDAPVAQTTLPVLTAPPAPALPKPSGNGSITASKGGTKPEPVTGPAASFTDHEREIYRLQADAPPCPECGALCIRSGACYKCLQCGTSLGCS